MLSDRPTPIHSSGTYPLFRNAAKELAEKLEVLRTGDALLLAGDLRWFEEIFTSWSPTNRPTEERRVTIINEFLARCTKAQELLK